MRRWGSVPLAELAAPAAALAREGDRRSTPIRPRSCTCSRRSCARRRSVDALYAPGGSLLSDGEVLRYSELGDTIERLGAEGAAPFYEGDIAAAVVALGRRRRRRPDGRGPARLRGDRARAAERALPRPQRAHQPAAVGRRDPARAVAAPARRSALAAAARARRARDGGGAGGAHAASSSRGSPSRASRRAARLADGLDDAHLRDRRRRPRLLGDVHQRRGVGHRRARAPGIHVNNIMGEADLNPLGFHHAPPGAEDAVDDVADGRHPRRRRAGRARLVGLQPHPLGAAADDRGRRRPRSAGRRRGRRAARALRGRRDLRGARHRRSTSCATTPTRSRSSARRTCSSAACRPSAATPTRASSTAPATRAAAAWRWRHDAAPAGAPPRSPSRASRWAAAAPVARPVRRRARRHGAGREAHCSSPTRPRAATTGPPLPLTSAQTIEARDITDDLLLVQSGAVDVPPPPPSQIFRFAIRDRGGRPALPRHRAAPADPAAPARFVRRVAIDTCKLAR